MSPPEAAQAIDVFREHDAKTLEKQLAVYHDSEAFRTAAMDAAKELEELFREDEVALGGNPEPRH